MRCKAPLGVSENFYRHAVGSDSQKASKLVHGDQQRNIFVPTPRASREPILGELTKSAVFPCTIAFLPSARDAHTLASISIVSNPQLRHLLVRSRKEALQAHRGPAEQTWKTEKRSYLLQIAVLKFSSVPRNPRLPWRACVSSAAIMI